MAGESVSTAEILDEFRDEDESVKLAITYFLKDIDGVNDTAGSTEIVRNIDVDKINEEVAGMEADSRVRFET